VASPRTRIFLRLLPGVLLAGAGCVSSTDIDGLHRQMNDIEKEDQALEKKSSSKEEVAKLNSSVSQQTQQLLNRTRTWASSSAS
jgi:hypothetical protein